jgi:hypothetical protein
MLNQVQHDTSRLLIHSDINNSERCHSRESGNPGVVPAKAGNQVKTKYWIPPDQVRGRLSQARNDRKEKTYVVIYNYFEFRIFLFSFMACQAIVAYFLLLVAPHAPGHRHINKRPGGRLFRLGDITVTGLAFDLSENDMAAVRIEDMIRLSIDPPPGDLFSCFCELPDLLLLRTFRHRFFVTFQANGGGGQTREALSLVVFVAGVTFEPLIDMLLVIERDRLSRFRASGIGDAEQE